MILNFFSKITYWYFFLIASWSYLIATTTIPEKKIVIVTSMYNNEKWVLYNLNSIFSQKYSNFRVIIVDDGSEDQTKNIIQDYIEKNHLKKKVTFIANTIRKRKLANLYKALYLCQDDEIVIILDGDDWLAHENVFQIINTIYSSEDVWLTYGQYYNLPPEEAIKWGYAPKGYAAPVPKEMQDQHQYRKGPFRFMHLRTFYGWLFKLIKLEDLLCETVPGFKGAPFPASNDLAMYYPMVESAHYRIRFIPTILCIRNLFSEIVGFKIDKKIQLAAAQEIRRKKHYPVVEKPVYRFNEKYLSKPISAIIICDKDLKTVESQCINLLKNCTGIESIYLLCYYNSDKKLLEKITADYNITPIFYHYTNEKSITTMLLKIMTTITDEHVMIALNNPHAENFDLHNIDFRYGVYWLEKTYAQSFYYHIKSSMRPETYPLWLVMIDDSIYAWKIGCAKNVWRIANPLDYVIYPTHNIKTMLLNGYNAKTIAQLMLLFKKYNQQEPSAVNLCYALPTE